MNNNNEKIDTLDFIKIKTYASRNTIGVKRSHRMGENNANHTSDKGLVSEYIKNTYNSIIKRKPN